MAGQGKAREGHGERVRKRGSRRGGHGEGVTERGVREGHGGRDESTTTPGVTVHLFPCGSVTWFGPIFMVHHEQLELKYEKEIAREIGGRGEGFGRR